MALYNLILMRLRLDTKLMHACTIIELYYQLLDSMEIQVQVAVCGCKVVLYQRQEQWNIALVELGKQSVTMTGMSKILVWFVDRGDYQPLVIVFTMQAI